MKREKMKEKKEREMKERWNKRTIIIQINKTKKEINKEIDKGRK